MRIIGIAAGLGLSWLLACGSPPSPKSPSPSPSDANTTPASPEPTIGSTPAPFEPVLGEPVVDGAAVDADIDSITTTSSDELVQFVEHHIPAERARSDSAVLREPIAPTRASFTVIKFVPEKKVAFIRRKTGESNAFFVTKSARGYVIPPIAWLRMVVDLRAVPPADSDAWYRALSQRIASSGRASGIALFANGNAMAVVIDLRTAGENGDLQLAAQTKFFKAGQFSADGWGPKISGADGVTSRKMNGHEGISAEDILRKMHAPGAPTGTGSTTL